MNGTAAPPAQGSGQGSPQGTTQVLPLLRPLPAPLDSLKERLESFSYSVVDFFSPGFDDLGLVHPPLVALIPISARTTLQAIQDAMTRYQDRFQDANTYFLVVYPGRLRFQLVELYRLGISGCFQSPLEDEILLNKVCELAPVHQSHKNMTLDQLVRINIVEIEREKNLPFDVFLYLPVNRKTILYLEKDSALDEKTIRKFNENQSYNLYIRRSDIKSYHEHNQRMLSTFAPHEQLTASEKSKKIASRIGGLMGGFFSDEEYSEDDGKQLVENLKAFVTDLEDSDGPKKAITEEISKYASQRLTAASHSQNVAAYCAYFGMTLGLTEPQTLRLGGLLHDIGMADLPQALVGKDSRSMSEKEKALYETHPKGGTAAVLKKKLEIPKEAVEMILYHHEHTDGSGYPFGKKGNEIPPYAKVCAFANEFDKLTSVRPGHPQLSPREAVMRIAGLDGSAPLPIYDPEFHKPLVDIFLGDKTVQINEPESASTGAVAAAEITDGAKPGLVTLSRLLKTEQFAKPTYLPEVTAENERALEAVTEVAEQLAAHFSDQQSDRKKNRAP